jgi:glycerol-3-phosphate O-acyltransferase
MGGFAIWVRLLAPLFAKVKVDEKWIDSVREQAQKGTILYVVEAQGLLDYAILTWLCVKNNLPVPKTANTRSILWLRPVLFLPFYPLVALLRWLFRRSDPVENYRRQVASGQAAVLFLKRRRFVMMPGGNVGLPYLKALVDTLRQTDKDLVLIPQVVLWAPTPEKYRKTLFDIVLGDPNAPGPRKLYTLLSNPARGIVTCGQPVSARNIIQESQEGDDNDKIARNITWHLHQTIDKEARVVRGPMLKTAVQIRNEMMSDPGFLAHIESIGSEAQVRPRKTRKRASKIIMEIAADFRMSYIKLMCSILHALFSRVFSSLVVDKDSVDLIRKVSRETPVVFVPCHRSHIDYLVISYLFYLVGVIPPHIAAGANLTFFPMGHLFRHSGAFFIRRKIGDDKLYGFILSQYIRKIIKEGYSIEFFIEGGRSRTGKTLPPKFGILKYVADAICAQAVGEVTIVPIALSYERIMEVDSYARELAGQDKSKEDIGALVKSAQVLDSRYGRLYMTAGRPIRVSEFMQKQTGKEVNDLTDDERRYLVKKLGYLTLGRINRATVVNPTGLVACTLLSHHRRGMSKTRFLETAGFLLDFAIKRGYPMSIALERALKSGVHELAKARVRAEKENNPRVEYLARGKTMAPILDETLELFRSQGQITIEEFDDETVLSVVPNARIYLNYYRNNVLHVYQREALVALSLYARRNQKTILFDEVEKDTQFLSKMFQKEFIFRIGDLEKGIMAALTALERDGLVERDSLGNPTPCPTNFDLLQAFRNMVLPIAESYLLSTRYASMVRWKGAQRPRDLARTILKKARKDYKEGNITCQESLSTVNLQNAINRLVSMGILKTVDSGIDAGKIRFAVGSSLELLQETEQKLARFVDIVP